MFITNLDTAIVCPLCTKMSERREKNQCFEIALSHLLWFKEDINEFLESTAIGDGILCNI
jgi:hypothetical protein